MTRAFVVAGPDDGRDYFAELIAAVNDQLADRGAIGNADSVDACFLPSFGDAVASLGGIWNAAGETYYVAFGGYPIAELVAAGDRQ